MKIAFVVLMGAAALWFAGFSTAAEKDSGAAPRVIQQARDGSVLLHSSNATVHGTTLRYEPATNKITLGFWTKKEDWASWDFSVAKAGAFTVEVLQGCGKGSGGAEVEVAVGEQRLSFTVQDTGHFQNFIARDIGTVTLGKAGRYKLAVKPKTKPGVAVMDLRQVTLRPVKR